jgi:hypothetical protein
MDTASWMWPVMEFIGRYLFTDLLYRAHVITLLRTKCAGISCHIIISRVTEMRLLLEDDAKK